MGGELGKRLLQHVAVDQPDQAHLLDRGDEFAAGDEAAIGLAHAQQALEIIDLARGRAHHRLKGEQQPVLAQRALDRGADRGGLRLPAPRGGGKAALHRSAALEGGAARRVGAARPALRHSFRVRQLPVATGLSESPVAERHQAAAVSDRERRSTRPATARSATPALPRPSPNPIWQTCGTVQPR